MRWLTNRKRNWLAIAAMSLALLGTLGGAAHWYTRADQHLAAAQKAFACRDDEQALQELTAYLAVWPRSASARLFAAQAARRLHRYDQAAEHLSVCRDSGGDSDAIDLEWMLCDLQRGASAAEPVLWARVQAGDPHELQILEVLTQHYLDTYRLLRCLECLNRYLDLRPDDLQALLGRAFVWERFFYFADALKDYRRAVDLHPQSDPARLRLAKTLLIADTPDAALEQFEILRQRQPGSPAVRLGIAQCRRRLGQTDEVRSLLDGLLTERPQDVEVLVERAELALDEQDSSQAEPWLRQALKSAPHDRKANYALYRCLLALGRPRDADVYRIRVEQINANLKRLEELTNAVRKSPDDAGLRCQIGTLFLENGEGAEGVRWLNSALRIDPRCQQAQRALADHARGARP